MFSMRSSVTPYQDLYKQVLNVPDGDMAKIFADWRTQKACEILNIESDKVEILSHEFCHAAYGYYGRMSYNDKDWMTVIYDGYGNDSNASIYTILDGKLHQECSYKNFNVGRFYRYLTLLLGMKPAEHEYKVMGLAPYATKYI